MLINLSAAYLEVSSINNKHSLPICIKCFVNTGQEEDL